MRFEKVAAAVRDIPYMSEHWGRRVYDHVRRTTPDQVLELGSAHGVSAAYLAAALEANGRGHLITADHGGARFDPAPEEVLERAGLSHRVTIVREHSSYNWFLKEQVEELSDAHGNCRPVFDFCYLDGAHNFDIDGLAVVLVEKLMRPGGWLLMDDLDWTYEHNPWVAPDLWPDGNARPFGPLSERQRAAPQLRPVFELILKQHPAFTQFAIEDEWYAWAQKRPDAPRRLEIRSSRSVGAVIGGELRRRIRARRYRRAG